jgi:hypothetical protein
MHRLAHFQTRARNAFILNGFKSQWQQNDTAAKILGYLFSVPILLANLCLHDVKNKVAKLQMAELGGCTHTEAMLDFLEQYSNGDGVKVFFKVDFDHGTKPKR